MNMSAQILRRMLKMKWIHLASSVITQVYWAWLNSPNKVKLVLSNMISRDMGYKDNNLGDSRNKYCSQDSRLSWLVNNKYHSNLNNTKDPRRIRRLCWRGSKRNRKKSNNVWSYRDSRIWVCSYQDLLLSNNRGILTIIRFSKEMMMMRKWTFLDSTQMIISHQQRDPTNNKTHKRLTSLVICLEMVHLSSSKLVLNRDKIRTYNIKRHSRC